MSKRMNLTNKLYQSIVLNRLENTDWQQGNNSPLVIELDPTAVCNLACPGCISEDLVSIGKSFTDKRLLQLGQEFIDAGVKAVILIGGGEPLAHRKVGQFIDLLSRNDVHIGITTNGYYLNSYMEQIAQYSKWTRVSVDAATETLFDKLRPAKNGKSAYNRVVENMRMLAKIKTGTLGFSYLVQTKADGPNVSDNIHEIYDAAVLAKDIGCDYFEVKPTYQFIDDVPHSLMKHDPDRMDAAREQIARLDELETEDFSILRAINLEYSLNGVDQDQPKNYSTCPSTHLRTTVTPLGVYVCPYWRGKEHMCIGNVQTDSFHDVWHSERRKKVMQRLDASKQCNFHCLRHETNCTSIEIKEKMQEKQSLKIVDEFDRFI
jgi:MoaA/NifB/PqqE/SkfB family radical SAM enzyme